MRAVAVAVVILLVTIGVGVFGGALVLRERRSDATKEARVACGALREVAKDDPDKTASFVQMMLGEGLRHAAKAEELDGDRYGGFSAAVRGIAARAGGDLDPDDVAAMTEICGSLV
jgi:hypothetical protein